MQLLAAGVERTVLALWLGHESTKTTEVYIHADLAIKERAIARTAPLPAAAKRYKPPDRLLAFLEGLGLCRVRLPQARTDPKPASRTRHKTGRGIMPRA